MESLESDIPELDAEYGFNKEQLLSKVASCTSDGASNATKTSKIVGESKQTAIDNILSMFDPDSPEVGAICTEYHVLHCANHGLNLLAEHSHSQVGFSFCNGCFTFVLNFFATFTAHTRRKKKRIVNSSRRSRKSYGCSVIFGRNTPLLPNMPVLPLHIVDFCQSIAKNVVT